MKTQHPLKRQLFLHLCLHLTSLFFPLLANRGWNCHYSKVDTKGSWISSLHEEDSSGHQGWQHPPQHWGTRQTGRLWSCWSTNGKFTSNVYNNEVMGIERKPIRYFVNLYEYGSYDLNVYNVCFTWRTPWQRETLWSVLRSGWLPRWSRRLDTTVWLTSGPWVSRP